MFSAMADTITDGEDKEVVTVMFTVMVLLDPLIAKAIVSVPDVTVCASSTLLIPVVMTFELFWTAVT